MTKQINIQFQGDLGFLKLPDNFKLPKGFIELQKEEKGLVLAYGEVSGHAHAIRTPTAQVFINPNSEKSITGYDEVYIHCTQPTFVYHEEHEPILLPLGWSVKWQQKEYSFEEEYRVVTD